MDTPNFDEYLSYKDGKLYWIKPPSRGIKVGQEAGFLRKEGGHLSFRFKSKLYYTHRVIYYLYYGYFPEYIDHIDGNKLNNNINNLRECTSSENNQNKNKMKTNTSGHTGVYKNSCGWYVQITTNKRTKHLGMYKDYDLACLVADMARDLCHGKFARINRGLF